MRIALIAHDNKKADMVAFVSKRLDFFNLPDNKIVATGTTGGHVKHAGIKKVNGNFKKGDHIRILDYKRKEFARGLSSFSSDEIIKILGSHSNEIKKILGYVSKSEVVHKDDMVKI